MISITQISERKEISGYIIERGLLGQYKNAKMKILNGKWSGVFLKKREPKKDDIWYFRINKQFRALCTVEGTHLMVIEINNQQSPIINTFYLFTLTPYDTTEHTRYL